MSRSTQRMRPIPKLLITYADTAMYRAKQAGRDTHCIFTPQMNVELLMQLSLEAALRKASRGTVRRSTTSRRLTCKPAASADLEALLRWERPGHGLVEPNYFIPMLEETGMIVEVGSWVIATVCQQISEWSRSQLGPVAVSVNVSGRQFINHDLEGDVRQALHASGIDSSLLELELTESSLMQNTEATIATLLALKERGVKLSIDDFGTGYSSLAYLQRFPIDKVKIDIAFVRNITGPAHDASHRADHHSDGPQPQYEGHRGGRRNGRTTRVPPAITDVTSSKAISSAAPFASRASAALLRGRCVRGQRGRGDSHLAWPRRAMRACTRNVATVRTMARRPARTFPPTSRGAHSHARTHGWAVSKMVRGRNPSGRCGCAGVDRRSQRHRPGLPSRSKRRGGGSGDSPMHWASLISGFVISLLLGALIYVLGTGRARSRSMVDARTDELQFQALHDSLTGLPIEPLIRDRMEQLLARSRRNGTAGAALYIDLDDFKNVNDSLGHEAGDQLLKAVASAWRAHSGEPTRSAAWGATSSSS